MADDAAPFLLSKHPAASPEGRRLISFDELMAMLAAGVIEEGERSELIEGELFVMPSEGELHVDYVLVLSRLLREALPPVFNIEQRGVLNRSPDTQLSPDIAVWPMETRAQEMTPDVVHLVVEISDSTLRYDKLRKAPLYARLGVRELWIMDVQARRLLVHRGAAEGAWTEVAEVAAGGSVAPLCALDAPITIPSL